MLPVAKVILALLLFPFQSSSRSGFEVQSSDRDLSLAIADVVKSSLPTKGIILIHDFYYGKIAKHVSQLMFAADHMVMNVELIRGRNATTLLENLTCWKSLGHVLNIVALLNSDELRAFEALHLYGINVNYVIATLDPNFRSALSAHLVEGMNLIVIYKTAEWSTGYAIDIIEIDKDGKASLRFIDRWVNKFGFVLHAKNNLPTTNSAYATMNARNLRVAAIDNHPFFKLKKLKCGKIVSESGMESAMLETLSQTLGFKYNLVVKIDDRCEYEKGNTSLNYLIHTTANSREADMGISEISITHTRQNLVDFSWPYFGEPTVILTKRPSSQPKTFIVLHPFSTMVWLTVFFTTVSTGVLMYALQTAYIRWKTFDLEEGNLQEWLMDSFKIFVCQCPRFNIRGDSIRVLRTFWALTSTVLTTIYSSQLTGLMTTDTMSPAINSLQDFHEALMNSDIKLLVRKGTHVEEFFQVTSPGIRKMIYEEVVQSNRLVLLQAQDDYVSFVDKVNGALFNGQTATTAWARLHGFHKFHMSHEPLDYTRYCIIMRKGFPYRPMLDKQIKIMVSSGLMLKWWKDMMNGTTLQTDTSKLSNLSGALNLDGFQGTFYIYSIGMIISGFILLCEKFAYNRTCRNSK